MLKRDFFARSVHQVAPELIGATLFVDEVGGTIVEVEAYDQEDPASHAYGGRTTRTATMFGAAGHAYVYRSYGIHWCLNLVCGSGDDAEAVLIRALEPIAGADRMRARRGASGGPELRLAAGPARLCQAMGIDRRDDGRDLLGDGPLVLLAPGAVPATDGGRSAIVRGPRVGVAYAGSGWADRAWRFGIRGHPSLSRPFDGRG